MKYLPAGLARALCAVALGALFALSTASSTNASTFVVDSTGDGSDASTADLVCQATDGSCTLRAAIEQANFLPGPDTITFNIPPSGAHTIAPGSALPDVSDITTIDGSTQPGFAGTPLIELDGANAGPGVTGLTLTSGNITIRGLAINRFDENGVYANNSGGSATIEGNYIGIAPDGSSPRGNGVAGVHITAAGTIGGASASQRNVISGNGIVGVHISLGGSSLRGNYIGTNAAGTAAVPNPTGVVSQSAGNTIDGNLISGNTTEGISVFGGLSQTISNNLIGTAADGTSPLPNGGHGIEMVIAQGNIVSGGNTIAFNGGAGICDCSGLGQAWAGNSVHSNAGLGIDIGDDGVTPNDANDADDVQNYPVLTSATSSGGTTTVTGTLNSEPNTRFTIEYLVSPVCDASIHGEGQTFLSLTLSVTTDGRQRLRRQVNPSEHSYRLRRDYYRHHDQQRSVVRVLPLRPGQLPRDAGDMGRPSRRL